MCVVLRNLFLNLFLPSCPKCSKIISRLLSAESSKLPRQSTAMYVTCVKQAALSVKSMAMA